MPDHKQKNIAVIGWREWAGLPELGIKWIKVKVDTGARSSALHAYDVHEFQRDGETWVRFKVHPMQRKSLKCTEAEAKILEYRMVRSSNGKSEKRPVIETKVDLLGVCLPVELTLTNRDAMGFRMLLGRQAIRKRFLVDSSRSYYGGQPARKKKKKKKKSSKSPRKRSDHKDS